MSILALPQVSFHLTLRALAYDGIRQSGQRLLCSRSEPKSGVSDGSNEKGAIKRPFVAQLGAGHLPLGALVPHYLMMTYTHKHACTFA